MSSTSPLRAIPPVESVLDHPSLQPILEAHGRPRLLTWVRQAIDRLRQLLQEEPEALERATLIERAAALVAEFVNNESLERIDEVINATGVVLHTNLGRAPLADRAIEAMVRAARCSNVEVDLRSGERRRRGYQLDELWRELTGAEASLVVNNCAAATVLALEALAAEREVIVSRGQLIEIGGSFRLPDVFRQSGAILREVGTTNRTRVTDYESGISSQTAALLRVHESNYRVVGFTESVAIGPMVKVAHRHGVLAIDDLGSGCLHDLTGFGLPAEPLVSDSLAAGADVVLFSGDKLLGGPQCGVLLGKQKLIDRIGQRPLARAFRVDKLTLAALQATLEIHLSGRAMTEIPVLKQLTTPLAELQQRAERLRDRLSDTAGSLTIRVAEGTSAVGGGSLPTATLPTSGLAVTSSRHSVDALSKHLRVGVPHVLGRIERDEVFLDLRTILRSQEDSVAAALRTISG